MIYKVVFKIQIQNVSSEINLTIKHLLRKQNIERRKEKLNCRFLRSNQLIKIYLKCCGYASFIDNALVNANNGLSMN